MRNVKIYQVGGAVRDKILGLISKDIDFSFVIEDTQNLSVKEAFSIMEVYLKVNHYDVFLSTPEMYTIRAKFPNDHINKGLVADFVLARKELEYIPDTRKPVVIPGTLFDDLQRRDFTVNAIAEDEEGNLTDPFNGLDDIRDKILRTPIKSLITFKDDPLRVLRALRFKITKGFEFNDEIHQTLQLYDASLLNVVSTERIREELFKMFSFNTLKSLKILNDYPQFKNYIFKNNLLWLKPTMEKS
jgi:poly(A) polymerase